MKRLILLAAFGLATSNFLPATAGNLSTPGKSKDDTVAVKLANGTKMVLLVKDTKQLHAFQNYSLDSLMRTLDKYIADAEKKQKSLNSKDYTISYNPAEESKNPKAPERIVISLKEVEKNPVQQYSIGVFYDGESQKSKMKVQFEEDRHRDTISVKKKCKGPNARTYNTLDIGFGLNTLTQTDDDILGINDLKPWGSRFFTLGWRIQTRIGGTNSPLNIRSGLNMMFYNYMFDGNIRVQAKPVAGNRYTYFVEDNSVPLDKSKLAVSTINLPMMAVLDFKNGKNRTSFRFGAGGFIGYRVGAHTKIKYKVDGNDKKEKEDGNFNLEDFQYGLSALIGYRDINLFANYNLNDLFKDNRGPHAHTLSFGIGLDL